MNLDLSTMVTNMLNGEPLHDGIVVATILVVFYVFYSVMFASLFSIFKKN